ATANAAGTGSFLRLKVHVITAPVAGLVTVYDGLAGPGVPSWQLMQCASKIGCTSPTPTELPGIGEASQGTPTISVAGAGRGLQAIGSRRRTEQLRGAKRERVELAGRDVGRARPVLVATTAHARLTGAAGEPHRLAEQRHAEHVDRLEVDRDVGRDLRRP